MKKLLSANTIKLIAIAAMTLDHIAWWLFPGYPREALPLLLARRREILELCARTNCRLHILSDPVSQLREKGASLAANVREVQIEDLLGR